MATVQVVASSERRAANLSFLRELIAANQTGEAAVQSIVADRLRSLGAEVETLNYRPADVPIKLEFASADAMNAEARSSIVGRFPGRSGGRSLILFAHPDGEPIANLETWTHKPFAGEIDGSRLHGWGVADDLVGVAIAVMGLEALVAAGTPPAGDVIVASTPSKRHARGVSAVLHHGYGADAAVYLHPAESGVGLREIKAFACGQLEFKVIVRGRRPDTTEPGHTAFAHRAVNPVDKAFVIHSALKALDERRGRTISHPTLHAAIGRSTNLQISNIACGPGAKFSRLSEVCVMGAALSFPPGEALADVQAEVTRTIAEACAADPWLREHPAEVVWISGVTGCEVPVEHPLYSIASTAIADLTGTAPHINPMHTSSDIRNPFVQKGIPTIGLGPLAGDLTQVGSHDEWVDLEDYHRAVGVTARIIDQWCASA